MNLNEILSSVEQVGATAGKVMTSLNPGKNSTPTTPAPVTTATTTAQLSSPAKSTVPKWVWWIAGGLGLLGVGFLVVRLAKSK